MASLMSRTAALKTLPSWNTWLTSIPYSNGLMFNLPSNTAALGETLSPTFKMGKSLTNSICPLTIFVPMLSAWKKLVCDGSMPVGPEGMFKLTTDTWPGFAAESLRCFPKQSRMSSRVQFVAKMKPMFPRTFARNVSMPASGWRSCPISNPFRIIVFLPITTTALPRRAIRMSCICLEATWSTVTIRAFGAVVQSSISLSKYLLFFASFSAFGMAASLGNANGCGRGLMP
mmetsp:Transcript_93417/g.183152  ORF Transcript_93417/g.183152 Transcript_93417/m.183152 type:complete len:230 (+) Transcript_93417:105-794(+)